MLAVAQWDCAAASRRGAGLCNLGHPTQRKHDFKLPVVYSISLSLSLGGLTLSPGDVLLLMYNGNFSMYLPPHKGQPARDMFTVISARIAGGGGEIEPP